MQKINKPPKPLLLKRLRQQYKFDRFSVKFDKVQRFHVFVNVAYIWYGYLLSVQFNISAVI